MFCVSLMSICDSFSSPPVNTHCKFCFPSSPLKLDVAGLLCQESDTLHITRPILTVYCNYKRPKHRKLSNKLESVYATTKHSNYLLPCFKLYIRYRSAIFTSDSDVESGCCNICANGKRWFEIISLFHCLYLEHLQFI